MGFETLSWRLLQWMSRKDMDWNFNTTPAKLTKKVVIVNATYEIRCRRQEEPAILISRLLLRMRLLYVSSIRLDFH